ncbi:MAG: site-specific DNA-methyltransferase [Elusimicrobiota bacterium]|jgi:DNA modification methylase|nr:site-specific DNA-methyltransferase [Elusimicrobiota bacterium]
MKTNFNEQENFFINSNKFLSVKEASQWATKYQNKHVSSANITYLINYGRIKKFEHFGKTYISLAELENYYKIKTAMYKNVYDDKLKQNLNWELSFNKYTEAQTTKHVHRLHPYKGKFIPQLVEYFLDSHIDNFKQEVFFNKGDIILDPFSGSGTTMSQSCELGLNAIGVDVSAFNALIANVKIAKYNILNVASEISHLTKMLEAYRENCAILKFEEELMIELSKFNNTYFPSPEYKYKLKNNEINELDFASKKEKEFLQIFYALVKKYGIKIKQDANKTFLDKWFCVQVRGEIEFLYKQILKIENENTRKILCVVLSRVMRSCRATSHADLGTLIEPINQTYYCQKHGKICKPIFSIIKHWKIYTQDTLKRIVEFDKLRTNTNQICLVGDSRNINLIKEVEIQDPNFARLLNLKKIAGIFSSPPYVGMIDYHEQHAYAYDLFKFERNDNFEIGPLFAGKGKTARQNYIEGISMVLNNCKKYLCENYNIFLVANDKYNLYPTIAQKSNLKIVNQFHRPVLNRTEKDKGAYSETIFHLRQN